jgi:recombination protein RecT
MYRAGAVQSVKVEIVKEHDKFDYQPSDQFPNHVVDWFGDRGKTVGVYAYAVMEGGATSKVIVMGLEELKRHRDRSASRGSDYSPWNTDFDAMAMKTAARQLAKWVPTSAEYRREKLRSAQAVMDERATKTTTTISVPEPEPMPVAPGEHVDPLTGEIELDDPIDAELVEEPEDAVTPDPKA